MSIFGSPSARQMNLGLATFRAILGTIFAAHGAQKLFVYGFAGVTGAFGQMGVPFPAVSGPAIAILEFVGGLALVAGFLTRPLALVLAADMIGAIALVHLPAGFFLPNGYEFALSLLGGSALLTLTGAGAYSVDARIGRGEEVPVAIHASAAATVARRAA